MLNMRISLQSFVAGLVLWLSEVWLKLCPRKAHSEAWLATSLRGNTRRRGLGATGIAKVIGRANMLVLSVL